MKIVGVIPARMGSSRFPGKCLYPILGKPMIEHVLKRAKKFSNWDGLYLATCDDELRVCAENLGFSVIMTSKMHTRAMDRVAEAAAKCPHELIDSDIVVCIQGDEPMLSPDMIEASIEPLKKDHKVTSTVLAMHIDEEELYWDPNRIKIVHNEKGEVLYSSRSPIPYCAGKFSPELGARRSYGIFAFRWRYLQIFAGMHESMLEIQEACDNNRFLSNNFRQQIAPYPARKSFSVDTLSDISLCERYMASDPLWGTY